MKDFFLQAGPWIGLGISVAIIITHANDAKTAQGKDKKLLLVSFFMLFYSSVYLMNNSLTGYVILLGGVILTLAYDYFKKKGI